MGNGIIEERYISQKLIRTQITIIDIINRRGATGIKERKRRSAIGSKNMKIGCNNQKESVSR